MASNNQHGKDSQTAQKNNHGPVSAHKNHPFAPGGNGKGGGKISANKGNPGAAGASRSTVKAARGKP
jgi:hypothetical protein